MNESVIVTGAASGIGRAIAVRLAADGWMVVGVDRDADGLGSVAAEIGAEPDVAGGFSALAGDVADRETLRRARAAAVAIAPLRATVGCAGITRVRPLIAVDDAIFDELININQRGLLWTAAEGVAEWLATGARGTFVAISSVHARHAAPDHAVYEMTKAAAEALVRSVAISHGPQGIRAVAVAPGAVRTPALEASLASADDPALARSELESHAPLRRLAEPADIAAVVSFVVSGQADFLSGESITVDGGWSAVLTQRSTAPGANRSR